MFSLFVRSCRPCLRSGAKLVPCVRVATKAGTSEVIAFRDLWKPALFAFGFSGSAFAASAVWSYEGYYKSKQTLRNRFREKQHNFIVAGAIAAVNIVVFSCFRVKRLQSVMKQYFTLSAMKNKPLCLPMILSTFSHSDFLHLSINMFVMFSFTQSVVSILGKEQFLAAYTSAGVFASLVSMTHKVITRSVIPSVGASGAILAIFAIHCLFFPDSRIQIVFLPFLGTSASYALPGMILTDTAGLLFKWRWLDHAAHLGGAAIGSVYYYGGHQLYQHYGSAVVRYWHRMTSR